MVPHAVKAVAARLVWRLYRRLIRVDVVATASADGPLIFACLHRDILSAIIHVKPARPSLLVSRSPDGDILIHTLGQTAYGYVRGATGEDGQRAFVALRRELEQGRSIGVAVDGPKGPFGRINEGILQLARLTGAPIVPLLPLAGRAVVLGTWDRTVVPVPFTRVIVQRGADLELGRDAGEHELEIARQKLAVFFGVEGEQP